jgi:hypothetical protein
LLLRESYRHQEATKAEPGDSDMGQQRPQLHLCLCITSGAGCGDLETAAQDTGRLFEEVSHKNGDSPCENQIRET